VREPDRLVMLTAPRPNRCVMPSVWPGSVSGSVAIIGQMGLVAHAAC